MKYSKEAIELEYYIKENISPVHYKIKNLKKHFEIRNSLYRLLGIIPNFLKGKDILEVAPGSGHNSIYTATLLPKSYDLVEPNPKGCKDIIKIFKTFNLKHTKPKLYKQKLDFFKSDKLYDLVITEGWPGGHLKYDKKMFKKLSEFVKPGGLLFMTFLPPIGAISTYLRRLMGYRVLNNCENLKKKTDILRETFVKHLNQMKSMSRSHEHWIQDSLLNPYIVVGYNTPSICLKIFGKKFEIFSSVPKLSNDWRWYKSIHGKDKLFNEIFLNDYYLKCHSLIDYNINGFERSFKKNKALEKLSIKLSLLTRDYENKGLKYYRSRIRPVLLKIIKNIQNDLPKNTVKALMEADYILNKNIIKSNEIKSAKNFSNLFGREQCYLTLTRKI